MLRGDTGQVSTTETTDDVNPGIDAVLRFLGLEPPRLRRADVEALTGVPHERSVRWWRAMGFPEIPAEEVAFRDADADMVHRLDELIGEGVVDDTEVLRLARLMGASSSRLVEAQLEVIDELLTRPQEDHAADSRRVDPDTLAITSGAETIEMLETALVYVWRRHLLAALGRRVQVAEEQTDQAVGFVDLSAFSRVTKKATNATITEIIDAFESVAFDVVSTHHGRVVKLIGDEVMFVSRTLDDAISIGLDMIARLAPMPFMPDVHCGIAWGSTVMVGGDVFGPTVNLASRLTDVARRGTIAVPTAQAGGLAERDDVGIRRIRRTYDLKGVGRTSIVAIRPKRTA